jgi:hypothetical protein
LAEVLGTVYEAPERTGLSMVLLQYLV